MTVKGLLDVYDPGRNEMELYLGIRNYDGMDKLRTSSPLLDSILDKKIEDMGAYEEDCIFIELEED